ncbi:MAG: inorganic phosphate transporter [Phycisphaerales bacterium]|nr:inorganic phosphate transporter [Phycisphaerales bacterium]
MPIYTLLIAVIVLAFIFDYLNGFHDAANAIATIVSTKVLTPLQAVIWSAFFNFVAFFIAKYLIGNFEIGNTISKVVNINFVSLKVILSGLVGAITWNIITWYYGIPSSSSHTLIGGFVGAVIAHMGGIYYHGSIILNLHVLIPIFIYIFVAPFIGMVAGFIISILFLHIFKKSNPHKADSFFKKLQLVSSAAFSIGHGGNDAQKVMGILGVAVISYEISTGNMAYIQSTNRFQLFQEHYWWVPVFSFLAMSLGILSGGWRIVKTMGTKITKVNAIEGVSAETAGALTLFLTEHLGIPVSTTHTITGSIIGVGATKRLSAVRWGVTIQLMWAWILTIPITGLIAAIVYYVAGFFGL